MPILEGFVPFDFSEGAPYVSITANGMTFNKSVSIKMNYPEYARLLINSDEKKIALVTTTEDDKMGAKFCKGKDAEILSVRWNSKDLMSTIIRLMDWPLEEKSYKVDGEHIAEGNIMLFDLKLAKELK